MDILVEAYRPDDLAGMIEVWNEVVEEGEAFPQREPLTLESGKEFFAKQDFVGVARADGQVVGLYILHPNNVGRCGHQCNASYAVSSSLRGQHIGEKLVRDCMQQAARLGYRLLIFNAVVKGNECAIRLYETLGFTRIGMVPGGFQAKDGTYRDTFLYYHTL